MDGYPETRIFCSNVGYVLAQTICFIFCKHEARSKLLVDLLFLLQTSCLQNLKQIVCAKTQPTLLQEILVSGYPSLCHCHTIECIQKEGTASLTILCTQNNKNYVKFYQFFPWGMTSRLTIKTYIWKFTRNPKIKQKEFCPGAELKRVPKQHP